MKILLLGEYSGYFEALKYGFLANGHHVIKVSQADGFKKIKQADISLESSFGGVIGKFIKMVKAYFALQRLKGYDHVFIINPDFFKIFGPLFMINLIIGYIFRRNGSVHLIVCGGDAVVNSYGNSGRFRYWPNAGCDDQNNKHLTKKMVALTRLIAEKCERIIPTFWEYAEPWRQTEYNQKVVKTLPLALDLPIYKKKAVSKSGVVRILHGANKPCHKGSKYILAAMHRLKRDFPDKVELLLPEKLSQSEYVNLVSSADVLIDQCKTYSFGGINCLIGMALEKAVLANAEPECLREYGLKESPVLAITPDVEVIYQQLVKLVEDPCLLVEYQRRAKAYVTRHHDAKDIAKRLIQGLDGECE